MQCVMVVFMKNNNEESYYKYAEVIRAALRAAGVDIGLSENDYKEDGLYWHFQSNHEVSLIVGIGRDSKLSEPWIVLEAGIGIVPESKIGIFSTYVTNHCRNLNFPFRFSFCVDSPDKKLLVLNFRSPMTSLNEASVSEFLDALVYIARSERKQLLELGLIPLKADEKVVG